MLYSEKTLQFEHTMAQGSLEVLRENRQKQIVSIGHLFREESGSGRLAQFVPGEHCDAISIQEMAQICRRAEEFARQPRY